MTTYKADKQQGSTNSTYLTITYNGNEYIYGLPWWLSGKESACNAGDLGSIPGLEDSLEAGTATHSSTLAWRILWTKEPGELQPIGLQRVRHD